MYHLVVLIVQRPKAAGVGHGGSVPRRNRLSVLLPVHSGGGRLQVPPDQPWQGRRGKARKELVKMLK